MGGTSCDAFLGGKVKIKQPLKGFRAGSDAVFLAASVYGFKNGYEILEVGSGVGTASLCLAHRLRGTDFKINYTGIDVQTDLIELAMENAEMNGLSAVLSFERADLFHLPKSMRERQFHHILTNPPFYEHGTLSRSSVKGRVLSFEEEAGKDVQAWIKACQKRLKPKGVLTMIHTTERLADILGAMRVGFGKIEVFPLFSKAEKGAKRVLVRGQLDMKTGLTLHQGLVLLDAQGQPTMEAERVAREGLPLDWSCA